MNQDVSILYNVAFRIPTNKPKASLLTSLKGTKDVEDDRYRENCHYDPQIGLGSFVGMDVILVGKMTLNLDPIRRRCATHDLDERLVNSGWRMENDGGLAISGYRERGGMHKRGNPLDSHPFSSSHRIKGWKFTVVTTTFGQQMPNGVRLTRCSRHACDTMLRMRTKHIWDSCIRFDPAQL
jgi:hypothetical protein